MREKFAQNMEQIPLSEALICINCSTICRRPKRYCPHCAGEQMMAVRMWLDRRVSVTREVSDGATV